MSDKSKEALWIIAEAAAKASDQYVILVQLPVKSNDEAQIIRDELVSYGCISRAEIVGNHYIRCQFHTKSLDFLN